MSNNENQRNGRRRPLPPDQTSPQPSTSSSDRTCRDFIWGICTKGAKCKFLHVLDKETMKDTLKFCHNFQNKRGCNGCTYLHASAEEENLFLRFGQIPRVLRERYAAMAMSNTANMYLGDFIYQPPPPPPPPPQPQLLQEANGAVPPLAASLSPLLALPPPPPPPPIPTTMVQVMPPSYAAPPSNSNTGGQMSHALPAVPIFDASRPPPPIQSTSGLQNGTLKRTAPIAQAGPSKTRKLESCSVIGHSPCKQCTHRKTRAEEFIDQLQKLECGERFQECLIQNKTRAIENGKLLLQSVVSPAEFRRLDEFIEGSASRERQLLDNILNIAQNFITNEIRSTTNRNDSEWTIHTILENVLNANQVQNFGTDNRRINPTYRPNASLLHSVPRVQNGSDQQNIIHLQNAIQQSHNATHHHDATELHNVIQHQNIRQNLAQNQYEAQPQAATYHHIQSHQNMTHLQVTPHPQNEATLQASSHSQNGTHLHATTHSQNTYDAQTASHSQSTHHLQAAPRFQNAHLQGPSHSRNANNLQSASTSQNGHRPQAASHSRNAHQLQAASHSQNVYQLQAASTSQTTRHLPAASTSQTAQQLQAASHSQNAYQPQGASTTQTTRHIQAASHSQNAYQLQVASTSQTARHLQVATTSQSAHLQAASSSQNIYRKGASTSQNANLQAASTSQNIYRKAASTSQNANRQAASTSQNARLQAASTSQNARLQAASTFQNARLQAASTSQNARLQAASTSQNAHLQAASTTQNAYYNMQVASYSQNATSMVTPPVTYGHQYASVADEPQPSTSYAQYTTAPNDPPNVHFSPERANGNAQTPVLEARPTTSSTSPNNGYDVKRYRQPPHPPPQ